MSKLKLADVRLSFPDLFEAVQFQGAGPFSYRASFLLPPNHPQKAAIDAAIKAVAAEKWGAKAPQILPGILGTSNKCCFVDGNTKAYDGYAGNWALTTTRPQEKGRPLVLDQAKNPLVAADGKPYAGCYVNASVEFWAQDNQYGKAIRCTLLGVQFLRDGDAFGGGSVANPDDFEDIAAGASADALA
jgi:hypothetical protein